MQDSITMADVGSIENVSGSRIATPLGPPRPGSTPTKMPRARPSSISAMIFQVKRTLKPSRRRPNASMLVAEGALERPLGHHDVEGDLEDQEHGGGKDVARHDRLPRLDVADEVHESGDEREARHVDAEPLRDRDEEERGQEDLEHPPELVAAHERAVAVLPRAQLQAEPEEARAGEDERNVEREVSRLRPGAVPADARAPVVPC